MKVKKFGVSRVAGERVRVIYLARWDQEKSAGVVKKIEHTVAALARAGLSAKASFVEATGIWGHFVFAAKIFLVDCDLLIVRATSFSMFLCIPGMIWKRMLGAKVVVDVPNPICSVWRAIGCNIESPLRKLILRSLLLFNYPFSLLLSNRVVQYGEEWGWFLFGLKGKTVITGNGVDAYAYPTRRRDTSSEAVVKFIAVAKLDDWHGYDRLIRGLAIYRGEACSGVPVELLIVGHGDALHKLYSLVTELGLHSVVRFAGALYGEDLDRAFIGASIAVGPLASHRIGLGKLSSLKVREYLARGVPVVMAGNDVDVPGSLPFVFDAALNDDALDVVSVLRWFDELRRDPNYFEEIQVFAKSFLDYGHKVRVYTDLLR